MSSVETEEIGDAARLAALAPEWWDLWRRCPNATPFQSPAWLLPWWRQFQPGELFAIAVRWRGRLVGLAPLYIEHGTFGRRILPVGISLSDYLDLLFDPAMADDAAAALVHHLESQGGRWDGFDLEELPPEAAALRLPCPADCDEALADQSACPVLAIPDRAADLSGVIPARKLRKLRMARNRAARRGEVKIVSVRDPEQGFVEALFRLHGLRWQSRGEGGVLADETVRRFNQEALPALVRASLARLYLLSIDAEVIGAYVGFRHAGRSYAYLGGFDPDFSFESPGTILVGHAIEEALGEGDREFHFLRGQEAYKYEWGATDRWNRRRSFRRAGRPA